MARNVGKSVDLERRYLAALKKHLGATPQASPSAARKLGLEAVTAGLNTSGLAKIHKRALMTLVPPGEPSRTSNGKIESASTFFIAVLAPLDKTHRAAVKTNGDLGRLRDTVGRRSVELADAQRRLKRELVRRKALEAALKESKQQQVQLLKTSQHAQDHLRRLSHQILTVQEEERKRISRELHDEIGQTLTAVNVNLAALKAEAKLSVKALKKTIGSTQRLVERSMKMVHRFARDLRPPLLDDLGLIPALHAHMKVFTKETGIPVRFKTFAGLEELDSDKRTVLYRVAQEAFANIAKHAQASLVHAEIQKDQGMIRMEIRDNGKSFDVEHRFHAKRITRLGLIGMRERVEMVGGVFAVESAPKKGTTITAQMPFGARRKRP